MATKTFLYFGYGSNMLAQRLLLKNPTAQRVAIGKVQDHRLDFYRFSENWGGCSATVVPHPGRHVWGAVWKLEDSDLASLEQQEGVPQGIYEPAWVAVETPDKGVLQCLLYKLVNQPAYTEQLPETQRPSRIYLEIILQGAVESKLPAEYLETLQSVPHNGYAGPTTFQGLSVDFKLTTANA